MWPSQIQQLTATVSNADNTAVTWAMVSGPGAINAYGVYTSPYAVSGATTATVRATSVLDPTKSATATVTINPWGAGAPYQYFVSDPMTAANPALWGMIGSATVTPAGLVADGYFGGGSAISQAAIPDGTNDYEVRATVHLTYPITYGYHSYSVLARASANAMLGQNQQPLAGQGTFYAFTMADPWWSTDGCAATMYLSKMVNGSVTVLSQFPFQCHDGMTMGMMVRDVPGVGTQITPSVDSVYTSTVPDNSSPITSGKPGVSLMPAAGSAISKVEIGAIDRVAPGAIGGGGVSAFANRVELQWQAAADDNGGSGVVGYQISRGSTYLGMAGGTQYTDETGTVTDRTAYTITAVDRHGNSGAGTTLTAPAVAADARRIGVRPTGAYWGAAGEQIDLLSGNLNFALPLIKAQSRGGWGATFMLSYNSQMWRQDSGGTWKLGRDVGYGLGWSLQAGSIVPVVLGTAVQYFVFTDATGAEYRLYPSGNGVFASLEGVHVWYDPALQLLHFPDGSWWDMYAHSAALEADAGTLYPTTMHDTNGNYITIQYQTGAGALDANTSARILAINDGRSGPSLPGSVPAYQFKYTVEAVPHLVSIDSPLGNSQSYRFTITTAQTVSAPFGTGTWSTALLQSVATNLLGTKHQLTYNGSGELTEVTTPLGGTLGWDYRTYLYTGTGRSYREVKTRQLTMASGGTQATWDVTPVDGATQHGSTTVSDLGANSSKVWTFGTSGVSQGLATSYEERGAGVALMHTDYTWTADALGNVYVGTVVNTRNPGSGQVQSKSTQTLDTSGNLTQSAVYDYGNLSTPVKSYAYTYLTDPNYTSRYILNRVAQVTMTPAVGSPVTLVTNTYDNYGTVCGGGRGMVWRSGSLLHDDSGYGTGFTYRGNATQTVSVGGSAVMRYESTGVVMCSQDGAGHTTGNTPSADTNYSLPGVLTPGGNSNLATTVTYTNSWAVNSVTGPNGANGTTTYDDFGRPQKTKIPDGAETDYTYSYVGLSGAVANQQTATLGTGTTARWKRTTLDGFGRVTRVESGNGATTNPPVSLVDTQYGACACSPLGKVSQVSMPYAPGGTAVWTRYTYDGSGRTLTVTAPDGSVTRTEYLTVYGSYTGNLVRVTDEALKWKIQQMDALGNLVRVIEPDPAGGADWITNYTYDALGHLTGVSMPRSNGTQTRTFAYTGADLTSATNPENGTVTYQYDLSHRVTKRTDALGQETRYTTTGTGG